MWFCESIVCIFLGFVGSINKCWLLRNLLRDLFFHNQVQLFTLTVSMSAVGHLSQKLCCCSLPHDQMALWWWHHCRWGEGCMSSWIMVCRAYLIQIAFFTCLPFNPSCVSPYPWSYSFPVDDMIVLHDTVCDGWRIIYRLSSGFFSVLVNFLSSSTPCKTLLCSIFPIFLPVSPMYVREQSIYDISYTHWLVLRVSVNKQ